MSHSQFVGLASDQRRGLSVTAADLLFGFAVNQELEGDLSRSVKEIKRNPGRDSV